MLAQLRPRVYCNVRLGGEAWTCNALIFGVTACLLTQLENRAAAGSTSGSLWRSVFTMIRQALLPQTVFANDLDNPWIAQSIEEYEVVEVQEDSSTRPHQVYRWKTLSLTRAGVNMVINAMCMTWFSIFFRSFEVNDKLDRVAPRSFVCSIQCARTVYILYHRR